MLCFDFGIELDEVVSYDTRLLFRLLVAQLHVPLPPPPPLSLSLVLPCSSPLLPQPPLSFPPLVCTRFGPCPRVAIRQV